MILTDDQISLLYPWLYKRAYALMKRMRLRKNHEVDDFVQDAMLVIWRELPKLNNDGRPLIEILGPVVTHGMLEGFRSRAPLGRMAWKLVKRYRAGEVLSPWSIRPAIAASEFINQTNVFQDMRNFEIVDRALNAREMLEHEDRVRCAGVAMSGLKPRHRRVINLYYSHHMKLREIGVVCGFGEARASQIHTGCLKKMRAHPAVKAAA